MRSPRCLLLAAGVLLAAGLPAAAQPSAAAGGMGAYLRARAASNPQVASSWRMLGRFLLQQGDYAGASEPLRRAVELDPDNAAAHFDRGQCLLQLEQFERAAAHLQQASRLAPGSDYGRRAAALLPTLPAPAGVAQVDYRVRTFDGSRAASELAEAAGQAVADPPRDRLSLKLEIGAAYNSNVTLTPISRDFGAPRRASAQGFFSPLAEYRMIDNPFWSAGPTFTGYLNLNENDALSSLNLQSYQPGVFVERVICREATILIPRLQYDFTADHFDGVRFGSRHAVSGSATSLWDSGDTSVVYWSSNHTDFADDSATPATGSRDGWTHAAGLSHSLPVDWGPVSQLTAGGDVEWADVRGADFAYFGGSAYGAATALLTDTVWCELEGGVGLRDYYRSTITPSRNETVVRASAKLTKQLGEHWSLGGVFNYDRFISDNRLFDAQRSVAGIVATFRR